MDATSTYRTPQVASLARIRGRTLRFAWTDGPTAGKTHEHRFHTDGTVDWRAVDASTSSAPKASSQERPEYFAADVGDDACFVSYLSASGFTLSLVVDFGTKAIVGVASNERQWVPVRGHLDGEGSA